MANNGAQFQSYFSYAGSINSDITQFPNSKAAYKTAFGG